MNKTQKNEVLHRAFGMALICGSIVKRSIPGEIISHMSKEDREVLKSLTAQDIEHPRKDELKMWVYDRAKEEFKAQKLEFDKLLRS